MRSEKKFRPPNVIGSRSRLATVLDEPTSVLEQCRNPHESRYFAKQISKRDGTARPLQVPCFDLKRIQRKLNSRILQTVTYPSYVYGGVKGGQQSRDYIACARQHAGAKIISKIDIDDFFTNVTYDIVFDIFASFFRYPPDVAGLLADLTTYEQTYLPQGAPSSPAIANLVFYDTESGVESYLGSMQVTYTRFLDDIVISSRNRRCKLAKAERRIERMLEERGLSVNEEKRVSAVTDIAGANVFGLRVNFSEPRMRKEEVRQIGNDVRKLQMQCEIPNERVRRQYEQAWHTCSGRVGKMARLGHPRAHRLRNRLRRIIPVFESRRASHLMRAVEKLVVDSERPISSRALYSRYNKLSNRVGVLRRNHPRLARKLRHRLRVARENVLSAL